MLGIDVSESTVAKYMARRRGRPSQNWETFLDNHLGEIAAMCCRWIGAGSSIST
jgi:hypothetical protein